MINKGQDIDYRTSEAKKQLIGAAMLDTKEIMAKYGTSFNGLSPDDVENMREKYGTNQITQKIGPSVFKRISESFVNPFTVVLFVLATISFITEVLAVEEGSKNPVTVTIILLMVFISGLLRLIEEMRSSKAAQKLSEMVETTIAVRRLRIQHQEIPIDEVVVGDIIHLAAGDMVPADVRILHAKDLFVGQSALTGESEPIEKFSTISNGTNPLELNNLAFMGTNVISGSAVALVIVVGDSTIFGSISSQIANKKIVTSFDKGVSSVSWLLIKFMAIMLPLVFFVNSYTKNDWLQSLLFALSIAVGLTPEMLPMIVSATLARGALAMSKNKVIVKQLNSIQNFGAIDILCTDKTGTITQDRVVLLKTLDIHGNENNRVLRYAYLNSYYQTGLKNLMDIAIINYAREGCFAQTCQEYTKIDEIPFDFHRRRMSVVVMKNKTQLITKGAIEEMLSICSFAEYQGQVQPMDDLIKKEILETVAGYNAEGLRVLGVAKKSNPAPVGSFSVEDEKDMVLIGYLAFLDPPKEETSETIKVLNDYGVAVKILTGDNDVVTCSICRQVGIEVNNILLGSDLDYMNESALKNAVESTNVFAKLSPDQKSRIVAALRANGHVVGFMGDGINDAAAMKEADVGISVDTAVDIAKESADIILLAKDLMILERGVVEGRKTYINIIKYIKVTASSNFGNTFSILIASLFLPFLPMLPLHILMLNLIYDISCISLPWDNVDEHYLKTPRKWDTSSISKFMMWIGPTSSIFDIVTYAVMYFFICPISLGLGVWGDFSILSYEGMSSFVRMFHTGWFIESLWSQTLVIHMIRTPLIPFVQSRASWKLVVLTTLGIVVGTILPYLGGNSLGMIALPPVYFAVLSLIVVLYMMMVTVVKKLFIKKYGELL